MGFMGKSAVDKIAQLKTDIGRLDDAVKIMRAANFALKNKHYQNLSDLGFTEQHIVLLIRKARTGSPAFPESAIRNNRDNIRTLSIHLQQLQIKGALSKSLCALRHLTCDASNKSNLY